MALPLSDYGIHLVPWSCSCPTAKSHTQESRTVQRCTLAIASRALTLDFFSDTRQHTESDTFRSLDLKLFELLQHTLDTHESHYPLWPVATTGVWIESSHTGFCLAALAGTTC
jgi:hypothetical protein